MDGNKDEALKCWKIGRDALEAGDRARALKFVTKARRLFPSLPVDDLLAKLDDQSAGEPINNGSSPASANARENENDSDSGARRRVPAAGSSSPSPSSSTSSAAYSEEQVTVVREIKRKKDYYEILGLEKSCTVEDIRKAYRKLSLKVHPDKNKAPGAEEAFKAVSKSFQCLNNEESRRNYDLVGSDEPVYERPAARGFNGFYEADIDADEIFRNFFFGGGMGGPATNVQFRTFNFGRGVGVRMGNNGGVSSGGLARTLIQLLPVIVILLLNFLPLSQPEYSLSYSYPYKYSFATQKGVYFYMKSERFEQDYPPNSPERMRLEREVEKDYVSVLAQNCQIELQRYQWGLARETPNCDSLKRFEVGA